MVIINIILCQPSIFIYWDILKMNNISHKIYSSIQRYPNRNTMVWMVIDFPKYRHVAMKIFNKIQPIS